MVMAPPEAPEGERIARLEALVESVIREMSDMKADIRDLRTEVRDFRSEIRDIRATMNRHLLIIIGIMISTWITVILAILAILFRMSE